jgi:hypothetical protein
MTAIPLDGSRDGSPTDYVRTYADATTVESSGDGRRGSLRYADRIVNSLTSCSFTQYLGAQPLVDPAGGRLYVAAEKIAVTDPDCTGGPTALAQMLFTSADGGATFGPGVTVSPVTAVPALELGPA